jgi:hypothetical protein
LPEFWNDKLNINVKSEINVNLKSKEGLLMTDKIKKYILNSNLRVTNLYRLQNYSLLEKYHL